MGKISGEERRVMRAALYARVSTEQQEKEGTSLDTQMEACEQYCESKGYEITYRFKEAFTGAEIVRPELEKLKPQYCQRLLS
jgi:site-specific DNA recombinase